MVEVSLGGEECNFCAVPSVLPTLAVVVDLSINVREHFIFDVVPKVARLVFGKEGEIWRAWQ